MDYNKIIPFFINFILISKCAILEDCCPESINLNLSSDRIHCGNSLNDNKTKNYLEELKNTSNCVLKYIEIKTPMIEIDNIDNCFGHSENNSDILVYCKNTRQERLEKSVLIDQKIGILNKCCTIYEKYNFAEGHCYEDTNKPLTNLIIGFNKIKLKNQIPICDKNDIIAIYKLNFTDIEFDVNYFKIKKKEIKINKLSYCLDKSENNELIVQICRPREKLCEKNFCIQKCCKYGEIYKIGKCVDGFINVRPNFLKNQSELFKGKYINN